RAAACLLVDRIEKALEVPDRSTRGAAAGVAAHGAGLLRFDGAWSAESGRPLLREGGGARAGIFLSGLADCLDPLQFAFHHPSLYHRLCGSGPAPDGSVLVPGVVAPGHLFPHRDSAVVVA